MSFLTRILEEATDRKVLGRALRTRHKQKYHKAKNSNDKEKAQFHKEEMRRMNRFIADDSKPGVINPNDRRIDPRKSSAFVGDKHLKSGVPIQALGLGALGLGTLGTIAALSGEDPTVVDQAQDVAQGLNMGDMSPEMMAGIGAAGIGAAGVGAHMAKKQKLNESNETFTGFSSRYLQEDIDEIMNAGSNMLDSAKDSIGDTYDNVTNFLSNKFAPEPEPTIMDKIGDTYNDVKDTVVDKYNDIKDNILPDQEGETPEPIPVEQTEDYTSQEEELLNYLRKELPQDSYNDMRAEILKHTEKPFFGDDVQINRDYNQGFVNRSAVEMMEDPSSLSRAEVADYVDRLYGGVQGKDNQYMDYGDENQSLIAKVKDALGGRANPEGSFDDTYMKNLDDEKEAHINKIITMRDQLKALQAQR